MSKRNRWINLVKQLCATSSSETITLQLNLVRGSGFQCVRTASVQSDAIIHDEDGTFNTPNEWYNRFRKLNDKDNAYDRVTVNGSTLKQLCPKGKRRSQRMPSKRRGSPEKSAPIKTTRRGKYVRKNPSTTEKTNRRQTNLSFKALATPDTTYSVMPNPTRVVSSACTSSISSVSTANQSAKQLRLDYRWLEVQDAMICTFDQTPLEWIQMNVAECFHKMDVNGSIFVCMCGASISMTASNWRHNIMEHVQKNTTCKIKRKRLRQWQRWSSKTTASMMKPPAMTPSNLKRMQCLGLWRTHYRLNDGKEYKMSLIPPLGIPKLYFISRRPITKTDGSVLSFAVHHHDCLGLAYTSKYSPEPERTCINCISLFKSKHFVSTLIKSNSPERMMLGTKCNNKFLSHEHLCALKKQRRIDDTSRRYNSMLQSQRIRKLQRRVSNAVQKLPTCSDSKEFLKHVQTINENGSDEMKSKALEFVYRLTAAISAKALVHAGKKKRTSIKKWGPILPIFTALRAMSLPRAERLLSASIGGCGPSDSTVKDSFRRLREQSRPCTGFDVRSRMLRAVPVFKEAIKKLGLRPGEKLIFQLACDATPIPALPEYDEATDTVTGTCGPLGHRKCSLYHPGTVGDGENGYNTIVKMVLEREWASYLYVCILQPMADGVPNQTVLIYPTCNRYDHTPHLEFFWNLIFKLFYEILVLGAGLPVMLEGKGADGDMRERCSSMQRMYLRYMHRLHPRRSSFGEMVANFRSWIGLEHATGFRLFGIKHRLHIQDAVNNQKQVIIVSGVDSSDPAHCDKKIDRKGQDKSKTHVIGGYEVLHSHLLTVMRLEKTVEAVRRVATGNCESSGVYRSDLIGQDPQNWSACVRRCGFMMLRALIMLQPNGPSCMRGTQPSKMNRACLPNANSDPITIPVLDAVLKGRHDFPWVCSTDELPELQTQGTVAFYSMAAAHTLMHNSRSWNLPQRVRFAGFVNRFTAGWRQWVLHNPGVTLSDNFLTKECYTDTVQNAHETVLTILVFEMFCPNQPCGLQFSGSNACEDKFSFCGGYSYVTGTREFTAKLFHKMDGRHQVLCLLELMGVRRGRKQHVKQEWPYKFHENRVTDAEYKIIMSRYFGRAQWVSSWEAGTEDAEALLKFLGCFRGVPIRCQQDPWLDEKLHVDAEDNVQAYDAAAPDDDHPDDSDSGDDVDDSPTLIAPSDVMLIIAHRMRQLSDDDRKWCCLYIYACIINSNGNELAIATVTSGIKLGRKRNHSLFVTIPDSGGVQVRKDSLVKALIECRSKAGVAKNSTDRLMRVQRAARRAALQTTENDDEDALSIGDDVAFAIKTKFGNLKLFFGRVTKMRGGKPSRSHVKINLSNPPTNCKLRCQWYVQDDAHYKVSLKMRNDNEVSIKKCLGVVSMKRQIRNEKQSIYIVCDLQKWKHKLELSRPSAQQRIKQQQRRDRHVNEARDVQLDRTARYRDTNSEMTSSRRSRSARRMGIHTVHDVQGRDLTVGMRVRLYHEGRVYGIGWGHRDLEYRRTVVRVISMSEHDIEFRILGLKSYADGYDITLAKEQAVVNAICLLDWCNAHPEDVKPE